MISRQLKASASLTFVLAVLFYLFFQLSKHDPALSQVNVFADDPYDAVGSFGIQVAMFTALLSLVRAFRPYQSNTGLNNQELLLVRGTYISCLSVIVTLIANTMALIRYPSIWVGTPAGTRLIVLTGGTALLTVLVSWYIHYAAQTILIPTTKNVWTRAICISIVSIFILAIYPENWRQSILGELFTALFGTAFFYLLVWAIGTAISPYPNTFFEDLIDDSASIYHWLKAHIGPFIVLCHLFEQILAWPFIHSILHRLNPRKHTWNLVILLAIVAGAGLTLVQTLGESIDPHQIGIERFVIVVAIFIGLECAGMLLGYLLLAKPLGLFRHTPNEKVG